MIKNDNLIKNLRGTYRADKDKNKIADRDEGYFEDNNNNKKQIITLNIENILKKSNWALKTKKYFTVAVNQLCETKQLSDIIIIQLQTAFNIFDESDKLLTALKTQDEDDDIKKQASLLKIYSSSIRIFNNILKDLKIDEADFNDDENENENVNIALRELLKNN